MDTFLTALYVMVNDFRRTFISDLIAESRNLPSAQELAGHTSIETTARYDRRGEIAWKQAASTLKTPYQAPKKGLRTLH